MKNKLVAIAVGFFMIMIMIIFNVSVPDVFATTSYYVATNGSDTNPGTFALPFQTIQKAADTMVNGDWCYIRGGIYRETVTVKGNGQLFQNFNGESVTISGCDVMPATTTWSPYLSYYQTDQTVNMTSGTENQIFYNGAMLDEARYPINTGTLSNPTLATISSIGTDGVGAYFIDNSLTYAYANARMWIVSGNGYSAQATTIKSYDSLTGKVYYNPLPDGSVVAVGNKYYLSGAWGFENYGQWFFNGNNKLVMYIPGGGIPNNSSVEYKKRNVGIVLDERQWDTFTGINLFACNISTNGNSGNNTISNMSASYVWHSTNTATQAYKGILLYGFNNTIKNSIIQYSSGSIISLSGSGHCIINCTLQYGNYEGQNAAIIDGWGDNYLISNNTISDAGRACIQLSSKNTQIQYNDIYNGVWLTKDCGIIYTGNVDAQNTRIHHNKVHDNKTTSVGDGIYTDNYSEGFIIDHNVIWNCVTGIRTNTPSNFNLVYNNTVGSCTYMSQGIWGDTYKNDMYGDRFFNNIFRGAYGSSGWGGTGGAVYGKNINSATDPLFVDETNYDYHLQSTSPAKDAGVILSPITDGYVGTAPDCGAYEYGGAEWIAGSNLASPPSPMPTYSTPFAPYMNLLTNAGFEYGWLWCWTAIGNVVINADDAWGNPNSKSRANCYSAKLGTGAASVAQTITGLSPNTWYTFSVWLLNDSGETSTLKVDLFGGTAVETTTKNNTTYNQYTIDFKTGTTNTSAVVYIKKTSTTAGYVYSDVAGVTEKDTNVAGVTEKDTNMISQSFYNTAEPAAIEHANFNMLTPDANGLLPHQYLDIHSWKLQGRNASEFIAIPREGVTLNADGTGEKYISWKCIDKSWITLYKPYHESYINKTPDKIIVEFRAKFQNTVANDNIQVHLNAPGGWPYIAMDTSIVGIPNPNDWHVWKIVFDRVAGTATEYVDDVIYSWQYHINPAPMSVDNINAIWNSRFESVRLVRQTWGTADPVEASVLIDYIRLDYSPNPSFETLQADGINLTNIYQVDGSEITGSFKVQNGYNWDGSNIKVLMGLYKIVDGQKILMETKVCYDACVSGTAIVDLTPFALSGTYDFVNDTYEMRFFTWDDVSPYGLVKVITK